MLFLVRRVWVMCAQRKWCKVGSLWNFAIKINLINFVKLHHLTFQEDYTCLHIARRCRHFLKTGLCSCPPRLPSLPDVSPIEHLWNVLYMRVCQQVTVAYNERQIHVTLQEVGTTCSTPPLTTQWCPCVAGVWLRVMLIVNTHYWSLWTWTIDPVVFFLSKLKVFPFKARYFKPLYW